MSYKFLLFSMEILLFHSKSTFREETHSPSGWLCLMV